MDVAMFQTGGGPYTVDAPTSLGGSDGNVGEIDDNGDTLTLSGTFIANAIVNNDLDSDESTYVGLRVDGGGTVTIGTDAFVDVLPGQGSDVFGDAVGAMYVGATSTGSMILQGTLLDTFATIGLRASGGVVVEGPQAFWSSGEGLDVGAFQHEGSLLIENGGTVEAFSASFGAPNSQGIGEIDGRGSVLDATTGDNLAPALTVEGDSTSLLITNGGAVLSPISDILAGGLLAIDASSTLTGFIELSAGTLEAIPTTGETQATVVDLTNNMDLLQNERNVIGSAAGALLELDGTITDSLQGSPAGLTVGGGEVLLTNSQNSYSGGTTIEAGVLGVGTPGAVGTGPIVFASGAAGSLLVGTALPAGNVIEGFTGADKIDLVALDFVNGLTTSFNPTSGVLDILDGTDVEASLNFGPESGVPDNFVLSKDSSTGTDVSTACYLHGTRILTDRGEILVEELAIGDLVVTLSGAPKPIKWIGRRSYAAAFARGNLDVIPICVAAGALAPDTPTRPLIVSPLHALYLDGVLVPAGELVNGVSIRRCPEIDPIRYVHVELDRHDVIFADGAPAETFVDCDSRSMFHNANEFAALYPGDASPSWTFCAPRLGAGERLEALRRRLEARAGLLADEPAPAGPLQGQIDGLDGTTLTGWAIDTQRPATPVWLEVLDGEGVIARIQADRYRADLAACGIGDGRHGFSLPLTGLLDQPRAIRLRRVTDRVELKGSPFLIQPTRAADALTAVRQAAAAAATADPAMRSDLVSALTDGLAAVRRLQIPPLRSPAGSTVKRALVIDDAWPRQDRDAGSQAVLSHMQALRSLGWQVEFACAHAPADGVTAALAADGIVCHLVSTGSVEDTLRRHAGCYDLVYLHRLAAAEAYAGLSRSTQSRARLVYSVADLHHLRVARQAAVTGCLELAADARALGRRELAAMQLVDAVITHSPAEAAYLRRTANDVTVHVVPWAVAPNPTRLSIAARNGIAFIGGFRHTPNLDAVHHLVEAVMPLVWRALPELTCWIVGPDWQQGLPALSDPRIHVTGVLGQLGPLFDMVRLTVAPLRFGAGLKGKVLTSFAAGIPCVMTPVAAEGLPLNAPLRRLVAEGAPALAERIMTLHGDHPQLVACAEAGLELVRHHFSADRVREALASAVGQRTALRQTG